MGSDTVEAVVEVIAKLEELRIQITDAGLFKLIDAVPSLLKKGNRISINDGLKIVAGSK